MNKKNNNKMSSDIGSVSDPKIYHLYYRRQYSLWAHVPAPSRAYNRSRCELWISSINRIV